MKVIIAPDSYKGALRAGNVAAALADGWKQVRPDDEIITIGLSDGGEGMAESLALARNGRFISIQTTDALMRPITAKAVLMGRTAVLETAEANGIERLTKPELDPLKATTYGVGTMMKHLLDAGCREFITGIGGSATVDGGAGMMQALGAEFFDASGKLLPSGIGGGSLDKISRAELSGIDPRLAECRIVTACDVTNPLCGKTGSAAVFGPQKGASEEMVVTLDKNLAHFAALFQDSGDHPGDGAAGGLGFALRKLLNAELVSGAELILKESGFDEAVKDASLIITGEGCSDEQTAYGKLCSVVAAHGKTYGVPTILVSGALKGDTAALEACFAGCYSIGKGPSSLEDAIRQTAENLRRMGSNLAWAVSLGKSKMRG